MPAQPNLFQQLFGSPAVPVNIGASSPRSTGAATDSLAQGGASEAFVLAMLEGNVNLITRFLEFPEKIEGDLVAAPIGDLQGETEELLRLLIQGAQKSIETLLATHQTLQTEIGESFTGLERAVEDALRRPT